MPLQDTQNTPPPPDTPDLLLAAARLLFVNGLSSESTHDAICRLGRGLGVSAEVLLRWGEVLLFIDGQERTRILPAKPTGVDMGRVTATLRVIDDVCDKRISPAQARAAFDEIGRMPPVHLFRFVVLAALGASALGAIFGAVEFVTLAVIALSAGGGALLRRGLSRVTSNTLAQPFSAALLAGLAGVGALNMGLSVDIRLVLVCPCMVLVPGPHVLNGTIDLARARITIGSARLVFAGLIVLMISAGLLLGLTVGHIDLPTTARPVTVPLVRDVVAAGLAVAAYGTFFNMPWRMLPIPIATGMLAHSSHWLMLALGNGLPLSSLVACLIVGALVAPIAARLHYPFAAFAFASVVSMVPGVFLFDGAAAIAEIYARGADAAPTLLISAVANVTTALIVTLAMTVGLIVPKIMWESLRAAARRTHRSAHDGS